MAKKKPNKQWFLVRSAVYDDFDEALAHQDAAAYFVATSHEAAVRFGDQFGDPAREGKEKLVVCIIGLTEVFEEVVTREWVPSKLVTE